jgi:acid phosphatase type 7
MQPISVRNFVVAVLVVVAGCTNDSVAPAVQSISAARPDKTKIDKTAILAGAGDIADCNSPGDELTAALLDDIGGTVFTAGDNAYEAGTPLDFALCYHPSWGRHKARTRPALGNHEYITPGAAGYYAYFGTAAHPPFGYYSYDIGSWHVVVIDSERQTVLRDPVQQAWLRADLAANPALCTLAYFHHPRFSSGSTHGSDPNMEEIWQILYDANADVVISGHEHNYERFAPQTPQGVADPVRGIREFVVGTGGRSLYGFGPPIANSEVRYNADFGVIKLILKRGRYNWEFIATDSRVVDAGKDGCH